MNEIGQSAGCGTANHARYGAVSSAGFPSPAAHAHLDRATLFEHFDHDLDLLREIAETFLAHAPVLLQEVARAAAERHPARLQSAAHSLKGSASNFGAQGVVDAAYRLERLGAGGELDGTAVDTACAELMARMHDLRADLTELAQLNHPRPRPD